MNAINNLFITIFLMLIGATIAFSSINKDTKIIYKPKSISVLKIQKSELILFGIVIFLSILSRALFLSDIPGGINQDGAMAAVDAKALADYGTDRYGMYMPVHFTAWGYGQMSVLLSYCMIPFIQLFGLTNWSVRLPILLCSIIALVFLYIIGKKIVGTRFAQILLIFSAFNPWHFMQSRWALDCNMFPHMFLFGFVLLLFGIKNHRQLIYISMIFFALCMYSYGIAFYTVPIFLLIMCIFLLSKQMIKIKELLLCVAIYLLIAWPIILTMIINTLHKDTIVTPFFTIPYFPNSVRSKDILFFSDDIWLQLKQNFSSLCQIYRIGDNLPWNTIDGFGAVSFCFIPFIFLGLYYCIKIYRYCDNSIQKTYMFAISLWFIIGNLSGIITANVNVNRINIIFYPMLILASLGIYFVFQNLPKMTYLVAVAYLIISIMFLSTYFTKHAETLEHCFYKGYVEAVQYVDKSSCTNYVFTPDIQYSGSRATSEIVTLYALSIDAKYYQGAFADENGLYYYEKYRYENAGNTNIDSANATAYVIKDYEKDVFENKGYILIPFQEYYAVIPEIWQ